MQIEKLIEKFRQGTINNGELSQLLEYLKSTEPNHEILNIYQKTWEESSNTHSEINSSELYSKILKRIGKTELVVSSVGEEYGPVTDESGVVTITRLWKRVFQYAAIFIAAFGLSWLVHSLFPGGRQQVSLAQSQKIEVPYGSKSRIELPDGSVVTLNAGSSLTYSALDFNTEKRSVFLEGEAFFNVKKNPARPFYVNTHGIKLKVLGTTFNVKAYPEENIEEATLVTGSVEISGIGDKMENIQPVLLKPNQKAVFTKSKHELKTEDNLESKVSSLEPVKLSSLKVQSKEVTEQTISWKDNMLVFDNEPFDKLVKRMERWYNVKIDMEFKEIGNARFSGKFDKETIEQVLSALMTTAPFKYTIKQNIVTITPKILKPKS